MHVSGFASVTKTFLDDARRRLELQAFRAVSDDGTHTLGTVCCQAWAGPVPLVVKPTTFKPGSVWGLTLDEQLSLEQRQAVGQDLLARLPGGHRPALAARIMMI